ncbi:MAG: hypothetical protein EOO38_04005 [Cytophagaceae bacterium]|nr:MAG: hypothetical protein EOO38_04005 [Cytophagaceae bacterium]
MAQSKAQVTAGLPYYHHPLMSPHPHLPAITLPGITAMNGLPVFGALSPLHPGVPMLPAAAAGDPLRMLTHSSVPMSTTVPIPAGSSSHTLPPTVSVINPSPVLPITHRAAPSAFAPAINPPKMHTVRSRP